MNELLRNRSTLEHAITLDAGATGLSGIAAEPSGADPRAVVVALHGGGMRARYFHSPVHPDVSLLKLGAQLGFSVLALDRPGYGSSAAALPDGQSLPDQSASLHAALRDYAAQRKVGNGFFLVGHSFGGKLALRAAADDRGELLGLDVSGCARYYAKAAQRMSETEAWRLHWGSTDFYPPGTLRFARSLLSPMPDNELREAREWSDHFHKIAPRIRIPVRLTFAEHEMWWQHDEDAVAGMTALFGAPRVVVDRQPEAGHNVSLGWAARSYHLRALAFAEECLLARSTHALVGRRSA